MGSKLDEGTFSAVYRCRDLSRPGLQLVIKVSSDVLMTNREAKCLKFLEKQIPTNASQNFVPMIVAKGRFTLETSSEAQELLDCSESDSESSFSPQRAYLVMPHYGTSLHHLIGHNFNLPIT